MKSPAFDHASRRRAVDGGKANFDEALFLRRQPQCKAAKFSRGCRAFLAVLWRQIAGWGSSEVSMPLIVAGLGPVLRLSNLFDVWARMRFQRCPNRSKLSLDVAAFFRSAPAQGARNLRRLANHPCQVRHAAHSRISRFIHSLSVRETVDRGPAEHWFSLTSNRAFLTAPNAEAPSHFGRRAGLLDSTPVGRPIQTIACRPDHLSASPFTHLQPQHKQRRGPRFKK